MARKISLCAVGLMLALSLAAACGKSSPTTPSVTLGQPTLVAPAAFATIGGSAQPITLTVSNVSGASSAATYTFEVATDVAFGTKVQTKTATQSASGQTSVQLDTLATSTIYYWHAKVTDGTNAGSFSAAAQFTVGASIGIPTLVSPANGSTAGTKPHFTINNSTQSSGVTVTYKYQIASDSGFANIVESGSVAQQTGTQTGWDASTTLNGGSTYYWRVSGNDSGGGSSGYSAAFSFTTSAFDPLKTVWHDNPFIGAWAETAQITRVDFSEGYVVVDFDKRQGAGKWPSVPFGDGGGGEVQYTLGMCFFLQAQWHCSAAIQFWDGRDLYAGGNMNEIGINWYYDARWGIMAGHQPAIGETVAIFAANGNLRGSMSWGIEQRTNFLLLPFGTSYSR